MCRALPGRVGYYGWKGEKSWFDAFFGRLGGGGGGLNIGRMIKKKCG